MTKSELIKQLASQYHMPEADARESVEIILETIKDALAEGGRVEIRGFGAFTVRERGARKGRNPKTGEPVAVPSQRFVHFKAGRELREKADAHGLTTQDLSV